MRKVIDFDKYNRKSTEKEIKEFEELIKEYKKSGKIDDRMNLRYIYLNKMKYYKREMMYELRWPKRIRIFEKDDYGIGFPLVKDEFKNSEIIIDYMAENMLNDIYYNLGNIEEKLHEQFNKKEKLIEKGTKGYILDLVSNYDEDLSKHLENHPELLISKENAINEVIERWDGYETDKIARQIFEFIDYHDDCDFDLHEMAIYLKYKLGVDIMDIYKETEEEKKTEEEFFDNEEYYESFFDNLSKKEQKMLADFEIIMTNFMKGNPMPDSYTFDVYLKEQRQKVKTKKKKPKDYE